MTISELKKWSKIVKCSCCRKEIEVKRKNLYSKGMTSTYEETEDDYLYFKCPLCHKEAKIYKLELPCRLVDEVDFNLKKREMP